MNDAVTDELRPEYDLRELMRTGIRGKYVERYKAGTNLVVLDPDVASRPGINARATRKQPGKPD